MSAEPALLDSDLRRLLLEIASSDVDGWSVEIDEQNEADGVEEHTTGPGLMPLAGWIFGVACFVAVGSALSTQPLPPPQHPASRHAAHGARKPGPAAPKHASTTQQPGRVPRAAATRRHRPATAAVRFQEMAWAPVPGSTMYEVAIYRGDVPVFRRRTTVPRIELPIDPHPRGMRSVAPGRYKWYVWPVRDGHRQPTAVVSSAIVLAAS